MNAIIIDNYLAIISSVFVGLAAGYLGAFMVMRRMALVGDALSHVALPGVALAILFSFNPYLGAFATLFIGTIGVWYVERKTELSTESLVGLFFTISLAIGLLITPREDVIEALFGDLSKVTALDTLVAIILSIAVIFTMSKISRKFVLGTLSDDLARSTGAKTDIIHFVFLLLVAIIVALGIKVVGTLLMGALVIIPAITSQNVATGLRSYVWGSALFGLLSGLVGVLVASFFAVSPGPVVVLTSGLFFILSFFSHR